MNILPILSASKIKYFKKCPRQYYHKYINHSEEGDDKNMSALLGSALHKTIELYYQGRTNYTFEFQTYMQDTIESWDQKGYKISYESNFAQHLKDGKTFLKKINWAQFTPTQLELRFSLPFPNKESPICIINGVIDMICKNMLVDHKSNREKPNKQELAHDPQFILYYWAHKELYNTYPIAVYWHHLRTGKLIEANIVDNYQEKLRQLEIDINALLSTVIYHRKEQDAFCRKVCSFYQNCFGEVAQPDEEEK